PRPVPQGGSGQQRRADRGRRRLRRLPRHDPGLHENRRRRAALGRARGRARRHRRHPGRRRHHQVRRCAHRQHLRLHVRTALAETRTAGADHGPARRHATRLPRDAREAPVILRSVLAVSAGLALATFAHAARPVPATAVAQDSLIRPGERHFAHLWQLTFGGQNAEGYWSSDDRHLIFQSTRDGWACDRMSRRAMANGEVRMVRPGKGRCTCGYFYDGDARILFASTHAGGDSCPPTPDMSKGYTWPIYETYDIYSANPDGSDL